MAWNPKPEVAVARDAAQKLNAQQSVVVWITEDGFGMASYGKTKALCKEAGQLGNWLFKETRKFLCAPYAALEQADDDEPIDAAFLARVGFYFTNERFADIAIDEQTGYMLWLRIDLVVWEAHICHGPPNAESDGIGLTKTPLKTHGNIRRLCAALGIPLKEQP